MKSLYNANASVQDDFEEIARLPGMNPSADIMAKYSVAVALHVLYSQRTAGDSMVERISEYIGWVPVTIYSHVRVAQHWSTASEFKEAALRKNAKGRQLAWAYFTTLARVPDDEVRELLYQLMVDESWDVRRLQKEIIAGKWAKRKNLPGHAPNRKVAVAQLREVINCGMAADASAVARQRATAGVEFLLERVSFREIEKLLAGADKSPQKVA